MDTASVITALSVVSKLLPLLTQTQRSVLLSMATWESQPTKLPSPQGRTHTSYSQSHIIMNHSCCEKLSTYQYLWHSQNSHQDLHCLMPPGPGKHSQNTQGAVTAMADALFYIVYKVLMYSATVKQSMSAVSEFTIRRANDPSSILSHRQHHVLMQKGTFDAVTLVLCSIPFLQGIFDSWPGHGGCP